MLIKTSKTQRVVAKDKAKRGILTQADKIRIENKIRSSAEFKTAEREYSDSAQQIRDRKRKEYDNNPEVVRWRGLSKDEQRREALDMQTKKLMEHHGGSGKGAITEDAARAEARKIAERADAQKRDNS